jgi:hypothetical protein
MFLMVALMTGQAFPAAYQIDIGQNGIDTGGTVNLFGQTGVLVDISVNGYACAPTDNIFGVQTYVEVDETLVDVTACTPLSANGCDLSLSGCSSPAPNVWSLICSNFNFITNTGGALTFGTLTVDCVGEGSTLMTVANDISGLDVSYAAYNDGFLADCNLANQYPTTATVTIEQLPPPCTVTVTPDPANIAASATLPVTQQFTATEFGDCDNPPAYVWSDTCAIAAVNASGLLTVDPTTVGEVCTVCVTDTANTGGTGDPVTNCADVIIAPGATCSGEIYLGGAEGICSCVQQPPVDDPPYNRPGRRGLSLTCGDYVDFCACFDCEGTVNTSWSVVCTKPGLATIEETAECASRVTITDTMCDVLAETAECTVTVTDPVNNWTDSVVIQVGEIAVDLSEETVTPETDSVVVDISVTNNSNTIRAMDITIEECTAADDIVACTSCVANPDRALNFTCTAAEQPDGSCRVVLFSPTGYIREGEGVVASVIYDVVQDQPCPDCVELAITAIEAADQFNEDLCACTDTGEVCFDVCGDIFPRDCLNPDCAPCGDGVVDLFDILEMVDIILAVDGYTATPCQLDNGDVPNGMPPYCGSPSGTTNCLTDQEINIFDLMVIIDMALGKANCCDYCTSGSIF